MSHLNKLDPSVRFALIWPCDSWEESEEWMTLSLTQVSFVYMLYMEEGGEGFYINYTLYSDNMKIQVSIACNLIYESGR